MFVSSSITQAFRPPLPPNIVVPSEPVIDIFCFLFPMQLTLILVTFYCFMRKNTYIQYSD